MLKTIVKNLPDNGKIVIIYDENFVKRERALASLRYHQRVFIKNSIKEKQTKLL